MEGVGFEPCRLSPEPEISAASSLWQKQGALEGAQQGMVGTVTNSDWILPSIADSPPTSLRVKAQQATRPCMTPSCLYLLPALTSSLPPPLSLSSSHIGPVVSPIPQAQSSLKAFALAVSSIWNTFLKNPAGKQNTSVGWWLSKGEQFAIPQKAW